MSQQQMLPETLTILFLMKKNKMEEDILRVKKRCDELASMWNGDDSGIQEDQAIIANEISEKCDEILELLTEL